MPRLDNVVTQRLRDTTWFAGLELNHHTHTRSPGPYRHCLPTAPPAQFLRNHSSGAPGQPRPCRRIQPRLNSAQVITSLFPPNPPSSRAHSVSLTRTPWHKCTVSPHCCCCRGLAEHAHGQLFGSAGKAKACWRQHRHQHTRKTGSKAPNKDGATRREGTRVIRAASHINHHAHVCQPV